MQGLKNDSITGLRGLLASVVVLYHIYIGSIEDQLLQVDFVPFLLGLGPFAVCLFFVVSGYLIINSLKKQQNVKKFIVDRMVRIYPVFLIIHLLIFIVAPLIGYSWFVDLSVLSYIKHFISNLLFLPGIFELPIAQLVAWSLSYEIVFYISSCLYFIFYRRNSKLGLSLVVLSSLLLIYYYPSMLFFVAGVSLSLQRVSEWLSRIVPEHPLLGLILFGVSMGLYSSEFIYLSILPAFLFFYSVIQQKGLLSKWLQTRVIVYLGNISYSLYLWHTVVMMPTKRFVLELDFRYDWLSLLVFAVVSLTGSLIVSHFSYKYVEVQFSKYMKAKAALL